MSRKLGCPETCVPVTSSLWASVSSFANAVTALEGGRDLPALPSWAEALPGGARAEGRTLGERTRVLAGCLELPSCSSAVFSAARRLSSQPVTAIFPQLSRVPGRCHGNRFRLGSLPDDPEEVLDICVFPPRNPSRPSSALIGCSGK